MYNLTTTDFTLKQMGQPTAFISSDVQNRQLMSLLLLKMQTELP
jgi:hypothetical protein